MSETCSNCKFMKFYNDGRLYPYKCTKENEKSYTEKAIENIVILNDEEGNEVQFEFLDLIEYDGEEYVILLPVEEEVSEEPGEVVILKLENTSDEEESYVSVDDEEILNNVFEIFKEKFKDEFNFTD